MHKYVRFKNTEVFEIIFTSNDTKDYPVHLHESSYIISVVTQGSITISFENQNKTYKADDCFIIPPNRPHSISINENYSAVCVCIKSTVFNQSKYSIKDELFKTLLSYIGKHLSVHQFELFMYHLTPLFENPAAPFKTDFEAVKNFIHTNITDRNDIDSLSSLSNYSKFHFERKFKKAVGLSPYDYQIQAKIKYAKYLLTTEVPIAKVAADLGFTDQSHFNRYFRKHVGMTPKQYIHSFYRI